MNYESMIIVVSFIATNGDDLRLDEKYVDYGVNTDILEITPLLVKKYSNFFMRVAIYIKLYENML